MTLLQAPRPPVLFCSRKRSWRSPACWISDGIHWEYEPRSFPLERSADGRTTQSFTPDFYLPDYDLFLEVTTVRPLSFNRKNRKIRKLREHYPEINIKSC